MLLTASFPHLDQGWLAWFALVPFLATFPSPWLRGALAHGATFGFFYFGGLLYWIAITGTHQLGLTLGVVAWLIGTVAQVLVMLLFAAGAYWLKRAGNAWSWRLGVPALWTLLEYVRQCGTLGTGWGDLAYTQHTMLPVLQLARVTGIWGITFLIVLVNVALAEFVSEFYLPPTPSFRKEGEQEILSGLDGPAGDILHVPLTKGDASLGEQGVLRQALRKMFPFVPLTKGDASLSEQGVPLEPTSPQPPPRIRRGGKNSTQEIDGPKPSPCSKGDSEPKRAGGASAVFRILVALLLLLTFVYGEITLHTERLRSTFKAAALQANINPNVVWDGPRPADSAYVTWAMSEFAKRSREAAQRGATLVVWPEGAFPGYLRNDPPLRDEIVTNAIRDQETVLVGGREYDFKEKKDANALFLVTPTGEVSGAYRKRQLVPFGEFVPYRRWLKILEVFHLTLYDMIPGAAVQPLLDGGPHIGKLGAAICYESSYPLLSQEQVARGAGVIVIVTDDTWYERTAAAGQHAAMAAARAVESDRYVIRSAATGISQIIAPTGEVLDEAPLFTPKVVLASIESRTTLTPSVRWPVWFVWVCGMMVLWAAVRRAKGISRN